ncbi:NACHT N-terminal Helical domain 1-containing protein [Actinomadura rudentiformis]|uniref:NACHT domain-containing protein n=1 Tax=Actinomadura rudentiformis TaxID=359158 RepID=A0A6H9YGQ1_9ACTN|nr:NACHT domain-containing protein [Actinomadura rudentiformis]KAB2339605.1 NACHT domain-containing protein [Actinomadura rudentiformis]
MSVEVAAFNVGRSVAQLAVGRWLAGRSTRDAASKDLVELIKLGFPDEIKRRRAQRQFEDIADSVAERLLAFARQEFGGLTEGDREAVLFAVVRTLEDADLSDEAFFAADADAVKLARGLRSRLSAYAARGQFGEAGARLYNVVLDECCDCLANILIHLPQFEPRASVAILNRLSGLADQVNSVLVRLPVRSLSAPEGDAEDEEFTRRYLTALSHNLDTLELFGVRFSRLNRPRTTLSVAYISLNVTEETGKRRKTEPASISDWRGEREGGAVRVESALGEHRLMLLRGEAGGGKSTLLRWLAVTAARGAFTGELTGWNGRVPFLIKLRSHADGALPKPEEFLDDVAGTLTGIMPRGWVHRRLESGRVLLLVDGVDEVTGGRRQAVRQWLQEIVGQFGGIRVIVTSRPAAAEVGWLKNEGFTTAFLEQMGPADIRALVKHWHDALRHCAETPCTPEQLPSYEAKLLARLESAPHLQALASSPLLAAMLCALNLDLETLPRDRMGLYAAALDLLLETRDAKRNVPSAREVQLPRDRKIRILQDVAWHLSTSGRVELPKPMVERLIADRLASMPQVDVNAADVLDMLLQRSGVIREPVPGRIDFVHRTVQEYLAAKQAASLGDMDLLIRNAHRDQWRQTVVMAAGHANEPQCRELIGGLLARMEAEPRQARALKLVTVACLETLPSVPEDLRQGIDRCLDDLVPPRNEAAARSLATAGEPVLARLPKTLDGLPVAAAAATTRAAWLINGPQALDLLARYAEDPRLDVQLELNTAWDYFDPAEYAERVLATTREHESWVWARTPGQVSALDRLPARSELGLTLEGPTDFAFLAKHAESLKELSLICSADVDPRRMPPLPELRRLSLIREGLADLGFLNDYPLLDTISLPRCGKVADFSPLKRYSSLLTLELGHARHLTDVDMLPPLQNVRSLGLCRSRLACDLAEITHSTPHVHTLDLSGCPWVSDLEAVSHLPLHTLAVEQCPIRDVSPLAGLDNLDFLDVSHTEVADLTPLSGLPNLRALHIRGCGKIKDLSPLADLPALRLLYISGMPPGIDLSPLAGNRQLVIKHHAGQEMRGAEAFRHRMEIY